MTRGALAPGQVPGLASRLPGLGGADALVDDAAGFAGSSLQPFRQLAVERLLDVGPDLGVAQLGLGLTLELGLLDPDREDGGQALTDVLAGQVLVLLLEQALGPGELVDRLGQGLAEAFFVGAALVGVDVVGEGEN